MVDDRISIKDALGRAVKYLKANDIKESTFLDAQLILSHIMKVDKVYLIINNEEKINTDIIKEYNSLLDLRAKGLPIQYIIGKQEFMSLPFNVNRHVLIPRSDTEILTEHVIDKCGLINQERINILDIGTGSACIAVSLAHYIENSYIYALDICPKALKIAKDNAILNKVDNKISFLQGDILNREQTLRYANKLKDIDLIVSNPPYIKKGEINLLQKEVKDYQPYIALSGGKDGLIFYQEIISLISTYCKSGTILALEIGYGQDKDIVKIIQDRQDLIDIKIIKDLAGINRVISASKK